MKEEPRKGASLAIVICIAALFLAFALAMVYTAGTLLSRAGRRIGQERSYQLACSFALALEQELKRYDTATEAPSDSFYSYACKFLDGIYGEYDPDHPESTVFHYTAAIPTGENGEAYGQIRVTLYKEANQLQDESMWGEIPTDAPPGTIINEKILRYLFTVEVTSGTGENARSYRTEYRQMAVYGVTFRHNNATIVWNEADSKWHLNSSAGPVYEPQEAYGNIRYEFQEDNMLQCEFENAVSPGGNGI